MIKTKLEWTVHFIPAWMKWRHSIAAGMEWAPHSSQNGMTILLLQEWNDPIPFQSEWYDQSIPAGIECHSTPNLKEYAPRTHLSRQQMSYFQITKLYGRKIWDSNIFLTQNLVCRKRICYCTIFFKLKR